MRITHLRLLAGAATAALLTGVLATPAPAAPAPAARANYQVPKVGSCHLLTQKQAGAPADGRTPVSCASKHTTVTIAVKRLTGPVDWRNTNALYRKIQRKCRNAVETTLGRSDLLRSQTAYDWFWFMPTRGRRTRGAKWLRCDLGLDGGSRLMPLVADVRLPSVLTTASGAASPRAGPGPSAPATTPTARWGRSGSRAVTPVRSVPAGSRSGGATGS